MSVLDKYFNNLLPGGRVHQPGGRVVCLKTLPKDSLELYMKGFKYLSLKEDAVELLQEMCEDDLKYLAELKKGTADAKIIKKALALKTKKPTKKKKQSVDKES